MSCSVACNVDTYRMWLIIKKLLLELDNRDLIWYNIAYNRKKTDDAGRGPINHCERASHAHFF